MGEANSGNCDMLCVISLGDTVPDFSYEGVYLIVIVCD